MRNIDKQNIGLGRKDHQKSSCKNGSRKNPGYSYNHSKRSRVSKRSISSQIQIHSLPIKGTIYLEYIKRGLKQFEGRVDEPPCSNFRVGDHLKLYDKKTKRGIICEILSKDVYQSFEEMLTAKGVLTMLPQLKSVAEQKGEEELLKQGVNIYREFPDAARVHLYGVAAIGIRYLKDL